MFAKYFKLFLKVLKFFVTDFVTVTVTFVTDINNNGLYQYCLMTFLLTAKDANDVGKFGSMREIVRSRQENASAEGAK